MANRAQNVLESKSGVTCSNDQLLRFLTEYLSLCVPAAAARVCDDRADARTDGQQAALCERSHDLMCCIGIYLEFLAQRTNRRKRVAGSKLACDRRSRNGIDDLLCNG
jgi:hypothetical protein